MRLSTLTTIAITLTSIAAIITALKVLTGFAPLRWLWRRLVHDPVEDGLRSVVRDEVNPLLMQALSEFQPNHGSSMRDAINRLEELLGAVVAKLAEFEEYQHGRNHDLANKLAITRGLASLAYGRIQSLEAQLNVLKDPKENPK